MGQLHGAPKCHEICEPSTIEESHNVENNFSNTKKNTFE